jgi:hypothetical protein
MQALTRYAYLLQQLCFEFLKAFEGPGSSAAPPQFNERGFDAMFLAALKYLIEFRVVRARGRKRRDSVYVY